MKLVLPRLHDAVARFGYLVPRVGEVADRFRDHQPGFVGEAAQVLELGVEGEEGR